MLVYMSQFTIQRYLTSFVLFFISSHNTLGNDNRTEWTPIQSVIIRVITKSDVYHKYVYRSNWTFNRKNYNFREKRNSQVMKGKKSLHRKTVKEGVNCLNVIG